MILWQKFPLVALRTTLFQILPFLFLSQSLVELPMRRILRDKGPQFLAGTPKKKSKKGNNNGNKDEIFSY